MTVDWPDDIIPKSCEFFLQHNTTIFASPITRTQQVLRRQGEMWRCAFEMPNVPRIIAQRIDALLAKLKGSYDTVRLWDFSRPNPSGANADTGSLVGETNFIDIQSPYQTEFTDGTAFDGGHDIAVFGGQSIGASSVVTEGWLQSVSDELMAGDYVEIGGFLYMLTDDADSSDLGIATLNIAPRLQSAVAHGDAVTRTMASGEFRLVDDSQPNRGARPGPFYSYSLSFVQAL